jgi:hypothetical protein
MKKATIAALSLTTLINVCIADETAVKSANGNIGMSEAKLYESMYLFNAGGEYNFNIYKNIGGSVFSNYSNPDYNNKANGLTDDTKLAGANIFLRDPNIGKFGVTYNYEILNTNLPSYVHLDKIDSQTYGPYGSYYLNDFTFEASRTIKDYNEKYFIDQNYVTYSASYYLKNNIKIDISTQGMDNGETYGLRLNYQPDILSKHFNLYIGAQHNADIASGYDDDYVIGFTYFFEQGIDLKTLDRYYR